MSQVEAEHYLNPGYITPERMASLSYQFSEIVAKSPKTILEIGIGQGLLTYLLRKCGLSVTTFDFDPQLIPDVVGDVRNTGLRDTNFDLVACFQVLEHLPFEDFETALMEINRITNRYALISLPHAGYYFQIGFNLPKLGPHLKHLSLPFGPIKPHQFKGEHYWEIGKRGYPFLRIKAAIKNSSFNILKSYRMHEHPYHAMFVLEKLKAQQK